MTLAAVEDEPVGYGHCETEQDKRLDLSLSPQPDAVLFRVGDHEVEAFDLISVQHIPVPSVQHEHHPVDRPDLWNKQTGRFRLLLVKHHICPYREHLHKDH